YPVHKFDNAFGGTKMDGGTVGAVVNAGNHLETNHFWDVKNCAGPASDSQQLTVPDPTLAGLLAGPFNGLLPSGTVPLYPPGAHCNQRGLTDLGTYLLKRMIQEHYIIEVDHMDVKTADQALTEIEAKHYSGVISPHSWTSPEQYKRIYDLGGFVNPIAHSSPRGFVKEWQADKKLANPKYYFGFGYGSDSNGLAAQSAPTSGDPIQYPFKSFDGGVTFDRERWGERVFDLNKDGVANYGLYADWLQELHVLGGAPLMNDMFRGAESYLQMWERAYGAPATHCGPARASLTTAGLDTIRLGDNPEKLLFRAGQPSSRPGSSYRYCVSGAANRHSKRVALFNAGGDVVLIGSTASGDRAAGFGPGSSTRTLRRRTKRASSTLWLGSPNRAGTRFVYVIRSGRVRFVAVAARSETGSVKQLRSDLSAAGLS
ncbi:MAG: hypothetical protein QOD76_924, partial [Solirubrobacteraceae bacterium]|nr:hypothetical protein [Solirubrobacteraceae bacterium]